MNFKDMFDLSGKTAIVTGGGRGIGKYLATGLAEAGANLVLASRKVENCENTAGELAEQAPRTFNQSPWPENGCG